MFRPFILLHILFAFVSRAATDNSSSTTSRIIGGELAPKNAHGSYVLLLDGDKFASCGGTAIQENLVLTAAHCVEDGQIKYIAKGNIKYDWKKKVLRSADTVTEAREVFVHPKYKNEDGNDIAVIRVRTRAPLPKPFAKLATHRAELPVGAVATAVGFGRNNNFLGQLESGEWLAFSPPRLYQVDLNVSAPGVAPCPKFSKRPEICKKGGDSANCVPIVDKKEVCVVGDWFYGNSPNTDYGVGLKSACSGDSGGPLYYGGVQYGIAESVLDKTLCETFFLDPYTVYTLVSGHRKKFIDPIVARNPYKKPRKTFN